MNAYMKQTKKKTVLKLYCNSYLRPTMSTMIFNILALLILNDRVEEQCCSFKVMAMSVLFIHTVEVYFFHTGECFSVTLMTSTSSNARMFWHWRPILHPALAMLWRWSLILCWYAHLQVVSARKQEMAHAQHPCCLIANVLSAKAGLKSMAQYFSCYQL